MLLRLCVFLFLMGSWVTSGAQTADSLAPSPNELLVQGEGSKSKEPSTAALLSAALPGLGQIYNKKYWKLPIVYGGAFALGYGIDWNNDRYNEVRNALFAVRTDNKDPDNPLHNISESVLSRETDSFRRDRDFLIIGSILAYLIVIVDSYVDAHLRDFPLGKNKKTALHLQPSMREDFGQISTGLAVSIRF